MRRFIPIYHIGRGGACSSQKKFEYFLKPRLSDVRFEHSHSASQIACKCYLPGTPRRRFFIFSLALWERCRQSRRRGLFAPPGATRHIGRVRVTLFQRLLAPPVRSLPRKAVLAKPTKRALIRISRLAHKFLNLLVHNVTKRLLRCSAYVELTPLNDLLHSLRERPGGLPSEHPFKL